MNQLAVRWSGGRAVGSCLAAMLLLIACPPDRLTAQVSIHPSLGLRYTSTLVHDSIVAPFDVRPAVAPALAVTVAARGVGPWVPQVTLDFSTSTLRRHDAAGTTSDLGRVSTLAFTVGLRRALLPGVTASAGVGALKYLPAEETGMFRAGTDGLLALGSAAVSYAPPGTAAGHWRLAFEARYDVHRFMTPALRAEGFTSGRWVRRLALALQAGPLP